MFYYFQVGSIFIANSWIPSPEKLKRSNINKTAMESSSLPVVWLNQTKDMQTELFYVGLEKIRHRAL